jgi:hypothetical protein
MPQNTTRQPFPTLSQFNVLGAHPKWGGGGEDCQAATLATNRDLKITDFVYIVIFNVLRDLPFTQNQPLAPTDEWRIIDLKNKVKET